MSVQVMAQLKISPTIGMDEVILSPTIRKDEYMPEEMSNIQIVQVIRADLGEIRRYATAPIQIEFLTHANTLAELLHNRLEGEEKGSNLLHNSLAEQDLESRTAAWDLLTTLISTNGGLNASDRYALIGRILNYLGVPE